MSQDTHLTVRFWGVRGSIACPGPRTQRFGGNTSCIEVRCGPHLLIFDAGTGIRALGGELADQAPLNAEIFLTHTHMDHVVGLPFFVPAYDAGNHLRIWAGHLQPDFTLREVLAATMAPPLFPQPLEVFQATVEFVDFSAGEDISPREGLTIRTTPLNHPNGATGYRVDWKGRSVCIITDTEHPPNGLDPQVVKLCKKTDLMIYDSMYTDEEYEKHIGWGHSTWQKACATADAAEVGQVALFHHDPSRDDRELDLIAAAAAARRPGVFVAREGLTVVPGRKVDAWVNLASAAT